MKLVSKSIPLFIHPYLLPSSLFRVTSEEKALTLRVNWELNRQKQTLHPVTRSERFSNSQDVIAFRMVLFVRESEREGARVGRQVAQNLF
jgi:hypothetical protein